MMSLRSIPHEPLQGLLPVCASCKKIRNNRGAWETIDLHIQICSQMRSRAIFTHGVCPECFALLYPGLCDKTV